jgi:predicted membrane protein
MSATPRLFVAIALIAAGTLMFLSNLGLLPEFNVWAFWPLIFVVAGVGKLATNTNSAGRALGLILIAFGSLFTLVTLGILHVRSNDNSWVFSLVLIAIGSVALIKVLEGRDYGRPKVGFPNEPADSNSLLKREVVFGSLKGKVESTNFQGGKLDSVFGSINLDFRRSQINSPERSANLEVNAVFGSVELRVPETWRVVAHAVSVFGSVEDKTLANKVAGFDGPTLFITGAAVFGSVEIKD